MAIMRVICICFTFLQKASHGHTDVYAKLWIDINIITCRNATPLLCETKSWTARSRPADTAEPSTSPWVRVPWPRLKCCDSHDYCNADHESSTSAWTREWKTTDPTRFAVKPETPSGAESASRDATLMVHPDRKSDEESTDRPLRQRVQALHIAAFVLAVAALISVLASCYVITRCDRTFLFM